MRQSARPYFESEVRRSVHAVGAASAALKPTELSPPLLYPGHNSWLQAQGCSFSSWNWCFILCRLLKDVNHGGPARYAVLRCSVGGGAENRPASARSANPELTRGPQRSPPRGLVGAGGGRGRDHRAGRCDDLRVWAEGQHTLYREEMRQIVFALGRRSPLLSRESNVKRLRLSSGSGLQRRTPLIVSSGYSAVLRCPVSGGGASG